jgi:hypothetical protein
MPERRKRRERAAREALSNNAAALEAQRISVERTKYTPELGEQIAELIADGIALDDVKVGNDVAVLGVCSRVGVAAMTIYRWQKAHGDFAESIREARIESSHRLADRLNSLAQLALDQPALANAVRVSGDLLKWSAGVRNPESYSERKNLHISTAPDLADKLRRATARVIDVQPVAVEEK